MYMDKEFTGGSGGRGGRAIDNRPYGRFTGSAGEAEGRAAVGGGPYGRFPGSAGDAGGWPDQGVRPHREVPGPIERWVLFEGGSPGVPEALGDGPPWAAAPTGCSGSRGKRPVGMEAFPDGTNHARSAGREAGGLASTQRRPAHRQSAQNSPEGTPSASLFSSTVHGAFSFLWQDREKRMGGAFPVPGPRPGNSRSAPVARPPLVPARKGKKIPPPTGGGIQQPQLTS